jgi:hypothetical protein
VDITQHAINIADDELLGDELNPRDLLKIYDAQMELLTAELRGAGVPEARDEAIERRKRALRIRTNYEFFVTEDLEGLETYVQRWACLAARAVPAKR